MAGRGDLRVFSEQRKDRFTICVEDNGNSLDEEKLEQLRIRLAHAGDRMDETTGLINVHRRIQLHYGKEYGLEVSRSSLGGLKVLIHLGME